MYVLQRPSSAYTEIQKFYKELFEVQRYLDHVIKGLVILKVLNTSDIIPFNWLQSYGTVWTQHLFFCRSQNRALKNSLTWFCKAARLYLPSTSLHTVLSVAKVVTKTMATWYFLNKRTLRLELALKREVNMQTNIKGLDKPVHPGTTARAFAIHAHKL